MKKGRSPYKPNEAELETAYQMVVNNCTITEVIDKLEISRQTFYNHYNEFDDIIKKAEVIRDIDKYRKVKDKLFDRAMGEIVYEKEYTINENGEQILKSVKEKTVCSDTAIIFYLVNKSNGEFKSINNKIQGSDNNNSDDIQTIRDLLKGQN